MNSFRVQVREAPEAAGTESVGFLVKQLVCYHIISLFFPSNHYSTLLNINTYHHYLSTRLTMTIQYPSDLYMYLPLPSTIFHGALPFPRAPGACGRFPSAGAVPRPGGWRAAPLRSGESAAHQRGAGGLGARAEPRALGAWEEWNEVDVIRKIGGCNESWRFFFFGGGRGLHTKSEDTHNKPGEMVRLMLFDIQASRIWWIKWEKT